VSTAISLVNGYEIFKGKTWWEYYEEHFKNIFVDLDVEKEVARELSKQIKGEYMDKAKWHIYDDVVKMLEKTTERGNRNIIISNHIPELDGIVNNLGISQYFTKIHSSGNIGYEKPNKIFYEYIINEQKINKEDSVIIGDSYECDIKGGEGVGIRSILVRKENKNDYELYYKDIGEYWKK
jgi:putative hydrolase of the HAD superfamily